LARDIIVKVFLRITAEHQYIYSPKKRAFFFPYKMQSIFYRFEQQ